MKHQLNDSSNRTIIECEVASQDFRVNVNIRNYSVYLLALDNEDKQVHFILLVSKITEISNEHLPQGTINILIDLLFSIITAEYNLNYVKCEVHN